MLKHSSMQDILSRVFSYIDKGSDYKRVRLVCKQWHAAVDAVHPDGDCKFADHLHTLLTMYSDEAWNWKILSTVIRWEWFLAHRDKLWSISALSHNPNITWKIISSNPDIPWDSDEVSVNPSITWNIIIDNPTYNWNWYRILRRPFPVDIILNNPGYKWRCSAFIDNPNASWESIVQLFGVPTPKNIWELSSNPNIPWKVFESMPEQHLNFVGSSCNPNITWEIVAKNSERPWIWHFLSQHKNITWEIIKNNPTFPWNPAYVSHNPNITWEIITNNPDYPWNFDFVSCNANITWKLVRDNPKLQNWYRLSFNRFRRQ